MTVGDPAGPRPYAGLRVLDFTHVIAGPLCTRLLADLGADVVKVESPAGDLMRQLPIVYDEGLSTAFAQYNCGKRSIGLNLKDPTGLDLAKRMIGWADVVAENFSPGAFERLGLGWSIVHEINPRAVMVSLSLFGQTGPNAGISGFGATAEAYSGLMSLAGPEGGPPAQFGTPLADMSSGVHGLAAIGAALYERATSGQGRLVDISSFDCLFSLVDQVPGQLIYTRGARSYGHFGGKHPQTVPGGVLGTANGEWIVFTGVGDANWRRLARAMGRPELGSDPRFADIESRIVHQDELYELIDTWGATWPDAATLVGHLEAHDLPAARVRDMEEAVRDPHLAYRGTLQEVPLGSGSSESMLVPSAPYRISGCEIGPGSPPPRPGEHTDAILEDLLGLSGDQIGALRASGAVF